jgi:hypothetical protein
LKSPFSFFLRIYLFFDERGKKAKHQIVQQRNATKNPEPKKYQGDDLSCLSMGLFPWSALLSLGASSKHHTG